MKIRNIFLGRYNSIRHFYLTSFLLTLTAFIFSIVFLINDHINLYDRMLDDVKAHNERIEQKFSDSLIYTKLIMSYAGRQISNYDKKDDLVFIRNLLVSYRIPEKGLTSWSIFSWVDADHQLTVSSGLGVLKEKKDLSARDYILMTKQYPETIQIGAPVFGILSKLWSIPLGYGVVDTHRKYIGAVVTGIIIENLKSQIEDLITNRHIFFAIVDSKNQVVAKSLALESGENKIFLNKFLQKITADGGERLKYKYGYYQKLEDYSYGIITIYDSKVLFSLLNDNLITYLAAIFSFLAFMSFVFYSFHNSITTSISEISHFVEKIFRDEPNRKIKKFEIDEMEELAQKLRKLDSKLSHPHKSKHD